MAVAEVAQISESRSASPTPGAVSAGTNRPQGARTSSPTSGSTRKATASTAGTSSGTGTFARRRLTASGSRRPSGRSVRSAERTRSTNACAAALFGAAESTQMGYLLTAFSASGNGMPCTLSPAARTSVVYTSAASTSPSETLVSAAFTSSSSESGFGVIFAAANTLTAAAPHGTAGAQTASFSSGLAKSARPVTCPGLSFGTAISSTFSVKTAGVPAASLASVTVAIVVGLAAANTSAGAPWVIWVASAELPAKLNRMSRPGLAVFSWSPSFPNTPVRDDAANTVSVPVSFAGELDDVGAAAPDPAEPPQPVSATSAAARRTTARDRLTGRPR